jgi:hypothetical protein
MVRLLPFRATAWLALALPCFALGLHVHRAALAQGMAAPAGQPMWINQQPTFQVGPNGAVNLDQSQPYTAAQVPPAVYPPQQYAAQPYAAQPQQYTAQQYAAQPWGTQAVAQQPTWGAPWMPTTNVGGSIPYFFLHRTSVFGEFLYMRPRDAEVAYAMPIDGPVIVALAEFEPQGPIAVVDPEYEPAFRVGGNLAVSDGNSIAAQYTRLRSETASMAAAGAGNVFFPIVGLPEDALDTFDAVTASALLNIELDLIDVDFRGLWAGCECNDYAFAVNYLGGVQYAMLDQTFRADYVVDANNSTTVNSNINFDGIGMRLGLQGERFFPASGLFVYGTGITSVLFGEFDATYRQDELEAGVSELEGITSWNAGRVVPVVDLELGGGWLGVNRHLRLSAGYRVSAWFNVVKTEDWIWAVQNSDFRNLDGTLTFDGLVARAEWLF